jgi:hypothetical protein
MEVIEAQPAGSELVDVRRGAQAAEAPDLGEAHVVEQDDEDIGRALRPMAFT